MKNPRVPRYRIELVRETSIEMDKYVNLTNADIAARIIHTLTKNSDREMLIVITLDSKLKVIGANVVSIGALDNSVAHPREMMKMAILQNASAIIIGHNHPSGVTAPSAEDRAMFERIQEVGKYLGIRVLDSIVVGDDYFSMIEMRRGELQ